MRVRLLLSSSALLFSLFALGCDCGGPVHPNGTPCASNAQCHGGMLCIDSTCQLPHDTGPAPDGGGGNDAFTQANLPIGVQITPPTATLTSTDGSRPTQPFTAQLMYADGTTGIAQQTDWSLDARLIGDIDPAGGTFTANGVVGGTATVTVVATTSHGTFTAMANLEVAIIHNVMGTGVPADVATTFMNAPPVSDTSREANLVYPLDNAVMPQNVYPADFQWTRGAASELLRITMTKPSATVTAYVVDDGNHHWLADEPSWRSIAQTDSDQPAVLRVDRIDSGTGELVRGSDVHLTFARAALTGSVYYWAIAQGRIIRIDDGTATRNAFMPNPEQGCVGCHSVSPSGRYMIGRFGGGDNVGSVFDLTTDLTGNPPVSLWPQRTTTWWFSSWSPDETRAVVTYQESSMNHFRFMDPQTGNYIDPPGMPNGTHPSWSHDGTRIAYATNIGGGWGGGFSNGDIAVLPVTGVDMVGSPAIIQVGADLNSSNPPGTASAYPSWSPGDTALAFAHGSGPRSETDQSALYIMAPDGSGVVRLDAANGSTTLNYQPRFSPFMQGGYFWLSFLSKRDYGNAQVGTAGAGRQQIWVTAIRMTGTTGAADPSSVPYWLPGQDTGSQNISAFWAPRACRMDGDSCEVGSECCGGNCTPDAGGMLVCSPPPPERCHRVNETCSTDADCCSSDHLACIDHVCSHPIM